MWPARDLCQQYKHQNFKNRKFSLTPIFFFKTPRVENLFVALDTSFQNIYGVSTFFLEIGPFLSHKLTEL